MGFDGNGKGKEDEKQCEKNPRSFFEKSGSSPPSKRKRKDQPLKVKIQFVEITEEERNEYLNQIAEVLMDSAFRELGVSNDLFTRKETEL